MVEVEPPPPAGAAGLAARGVRPRKVSAKRSWPPGCGRFPAPPPPVTADGDGGENGAVGVAQGGVEGEEVASVKRSSPSGCGLAVPALAPPPSAGGGDGDGEEDANGAVAEGTPEEVVAAVVVSPPVCDGARPLALSQPDPERAVEEEGERREAQAPGGGDARWSDGQGEIMVLDVMPLAMAAPVEDVGSVEDVGDVSGLAPMERMEGNGGAELVRKVTHDEIGSKVGVDELERMEEDGHDGGRKKRWLTSVVNPSPKRRVVSAIRRFPPGCGRAAATLPGSGREEGLLFKATPVSVASGGASMADALATATVSRGASSVFCRDASNEELEHKRMEDEGSRIQEIQSTGDVAQDDFVGAKHDIASPPFIVKKPSPRHDFDERMDGKGAPHDRKCVAQEVGDANMTHKESTRETHVRGRVDVKAKGKISESNKMNETLQDDASDSRDGKMRSKTSSVERAVVSDVNKKQGKVARKIGGTRKGTLNRPSEEPKCGKDIVSGRIDDDMDLASERLIVQALMAPDKCPWTQGRKSIASVSRSHTPRHKLKKINATPRKEVKDVTLREEIKDVTPRKLSSSKVVSSKALVSSKAIRHEATVDNGESHSEDEDNSKELVVQGNNELCVNIPPCAPSGTDARSKVRKLLQVFQTTCRKLMQVEEQEKRSVGRIDMVAASKMKEYNGYIKPGPIVGNIPGVEVGDEFHFRVELAMVGLHRPYQAGIDTCRVNGIPVAISVVSSGGYHDELSKSDELIYSGSGGKAIGKKKTEDQKLERGNLGLKNCIATKTPVRVIHGFKGQSSGEGSHSKSKQISTYTYDGLYTVEDYYPEKPVQGSLVYKFKMHRIPGQPELALHIVKDTRKSKDRKGLCLPDMSQGSERIPIMAINTIDDMQPAPFKYTTKVIYPHSYAREPPKGCDCANGCSDSRRCPCAVKNGGEIPFNSDGAIVQAKPLIYECGPSCRCPPTCRNRVSQHGIKIPLEIFKTENRGWGVRSLSSIASGSFVCEYAGEILQDIEDEHIENDEYLFDIGRNYHDKEPWKDIPVIPSLKHSTSETTEDKTAFTIDAAKCSNVGRFINHRCSPNLYAQNVLWDHDDMKMPHVMFFACENIPPLQELTYDYNYSEVKDNNGKEKIKQCFCGSSDCCGRLY